MTLISVYIRFILLITIIQADSCFQYRFYGVDNPCQGYTCPVNAWCIPSDDFTTPKCVCHQSCYDVGDYDESFPICGSNGVNYKSLCHLKREACSLKLDIRVKYWGRCNPCDSINCPLDTICQLDEHRIPGCRCSDLECTASVDKPVCANDGRTYANTCVMRQQACLRDQQLHVLFDDNCADGGFIFTSYFLCF